MTSKEKIILGILCLVVVFVFYVALLVWHGQYLDNVGATQEARLDAILQDANGTP